MAEPGIPQACFACFYNFKVLVLMDLIFGRNVKAMCLFIVGRRKPAMP